MPEYRVTKKCSYRSWCIVESDNPEEAEHLAIQNDNWHGNSENTIDTFEVDEE